VRTLFANDSYDAVSSDENVTPPAASSRCATGN
jgi:hypothetical protein